MNEAAVEEVITTIVEDRESVTMGVSHARGIIGIVNLAIESTMMVLRIEGDEDEEPLTDPDGWVYADNKWEGASNKGGMGKVCPRG